MSIDYSNVKFNYIVIDNDYNKMKEEVEKIVIAHGEQALFLENGKIVKTLLKRQEITQETITILFKYIKGFLCSYAQRHLISSLLSDDKFQSIASKHPDYNSIIDLM